MKKQAHRLRPLLVFFFVFVNSKSAKKCGHPPHLVCFRHPLLFASYNGTLPRAEARAETRNTSKISK